MKDNKISKETDLIANIRYHVERSLLDTFSSCNGDEITEFTKEVYKYLKSKE